MRVGHCIYLFLSWTWNVSEYWAGVAWQQNKMGIKCKQASSDNRWKTRKGGWGNLAFRSDFLGARQACVHARWEHSATTKMNWKHPDSLSSKDPFFLNCFPISGHTFKCETDMPGNPFQKQDFKKDFLRLLFFVN